VWESKKLKSGMVAGQRRHHPHDHPAFDDALLRARTQAENYARALPAAEGRPPFVVVVDVGHVIELYAEFTRSGATYTPFPDPRSHRIRLEQLADPAIRKRLKALWTDPLSLDPSRASARVTREVAAELAELAKSLEAAGHTPHHVAGFLTRCLFSMFAEDVGLLPKSGPEGLGSFVHLLRQHREQPATLAQMLKIFWAGMDAGGFNAAIAADVLRFNGKLFKGAAADGYVLPLTTAQIDGLLRAARANWTEVEPAIFGTLLERALDPTERHALGAHYTPRAYVERLVLPTVVEPLRADWANAQAAAIVLAREADELEGKKREAKLEEARAEIRRFHHQLCTTRVLDPACGSGNFLYVTLEHLKRLEGEVMNQLEALGQTQERLGLEGETVTLQQLRGIELNERAAALAELVLWIGWLQWHVRTRGLASVAEPVVHDYGNIEHRDAVLAYDRAELATDDSGQVITRWDGTTFKKHPVTGEDVPDEAAQVPQWRYVNPRPAEWPAADFIVGNPPFIGAGRHARRFGRRLCANAARHLARRARERGLCHVLVAPRGLAGACRLGSAVRVHHDQQPAADLQPAGGAGGAGRGDGGGLAGQGCGGTGGGRGGACRGPHTAKCAEIGPRHAPPRLSGARLGLRNTGSPLGRWRRQCRRAHCDDGRRRWSPGRAPADGDGRARGLRRGSGREPGRSARPLARRPAPRGERGERQAASFKPGTQQPWCPAFRRRLHRQPQRSLHTWLGHRAGAGAPRPRVPQWPRPDGVAPRRAGHRLVRAER
jgi:hypothetical protein